jgi:hypothetical protein
MGKSVPTLPQLCATLEGHRCLQPSGTVNDHQVVNWAINEGKRHNHWSRASSNTLGIGTIMANSLKTPYGECQSL